MSGRANVARAIAQYERDHWGQRGPYALIHARIPNPREAVPVMLGELVSVVYRTRKGDDRDLVDYEHEFRAKARPILAYVPSGLVIAGGTYTIEPRGIVG